MDELQNTFEFLVKIVERLGLLTKSQLKWSVLIINKSYSQLPPRRISCSIIK